MASLTVFVKYLLLIFVTTVFLWLLWRRRENTSQHPIVKLLSILYLGIHSEGISQQERLRLGYQEDAYIYGEVDPSSFLLLLEKVNPQSGEVFYDLGSGAGKAVFTAALAYDFAKVYGIELLPGLCKLANSQMIKAKALLNLSGDKKQSALYLQRLAGVQFIQGNFLESDISGGDLIFINATCLNYYTWEALVEKLKVLKKGSRIIVTTKKIQNAQFEVLYQGREHMSWGMNSVNIYKKIS